MLTWLHRDSLTFPPLNKALREPNGLLAAGGDLRPARLLQAYRHGCFPWPPSVFTPARLALTTSKSMRSAAMPGWLSLVCGIAVIVSAAYLLLVILRPEKF